MKKILAWLLVLMLLCGGAAVAESLATLTDIDAQE